MKKILSILMLLCLVTAGFSLAPREAQAAGFSITSVSDVGDGSVRISWTSSSNGGPYKVVATHKPEGIRWNIEQTSSTSCYTGELVCGETYDLQIRDAGGSLSDTYTYTVPYRTFNEFGVKIGMTLKTKTNDRFREVQSFSASDIISNLRNTTYGAKITLNYSRLRNKREYNWTVAFILPNGDTYVDLFTLDDLPAGQSYSYWNFYNMNNMFNSIYKAMDEIPLGYWSWNLYFDGKFVSSYSFQIRR